MRGKIRNIITGLFLLTIVPVFGQQTFEQRILEIEKILTVKSQEEIPGLLETAQFSVAGTPVQDLIRGVAEAHNLNVSISPLIDVNITNNFTNVVVKDLLLFLCREYRLNLEFINNIISFSNFIDPLVVQEPAKRKLPKIEYNQESDKLSTDLTNDSLSLFVRELSRISGRNVLTGPNVEEKLINGFVTNVDFKEGLDKIAFVNGLIMETDSTRLFFILHESKKEDNILPSDNKVTNTTVRNTNSSTKLTSSRAANDDNLLIVEKGKGNTINIEAVNVPIAELIKEAAAEMGVNYIFFSKPEGNANLRIKENSFEDFLGFLLRGTDHTFVKQEEVHIIGSRISEGFRKTKLVKFQFRTAWEIEKSIPETLLKDIQVLPFEELNALILSGSANRVDEVETLLKELDQPVPNIMIDVIVLEVRKSFNIQVGLSALLGDSVAKTQGRIHPGVNVSVGTNTINNVLDKVGASSVNLGRVKPSFYLTLQAMEQNGNAKIRSTPKLSTLNGHEAILTIGKSVYYQEKTQNVTGGVNPIITTTPRFNKVDANLSIKIKPMVSSDESITLDIEAEFSDFIPPEIEDAPPGNATRKFISQIRIQNEEMILLGGLEEVSKEQTGSGIPVLSRIPVLKWLFSTRSKNETENKLLVLIKPQIVY